MRPLVHFLLWSFRLARAQTQTTATEQECLVRYASGSSAIVEIGVWHGVNTARLREVMSDDGMLWAVDPFYPGRLRVSLQRIVARREVGRGRRGSVRWIRTTGADAASLVAGPVEFIFMDGDHRYDVVAREWELWSPRVVSGGYVALHDSMSTPDRDLSQAGSCRATADLILRDDRFELVEVVDSLTIVRRLQV